MRVTKFAASAIAVAACGSVAVAVAGPSLAAVNAPDPDMSVVVAPDRRVPPAAALQQQLDAVGALGETLTLVSRIGKESQSRTPDVAALKELQQRVRSSTARLADSVRQAPPGTGRQAADPAGDVRDLLAKLAAAIQKLIDAAEKKDAAGVQAAITEALTVVKELLAKLPVAPGGAPVTSRLPL
ncbi:hypothetical protein [Streptomyces sp. NPDC008001]|uniref:hypothetical protein n=1 Tax=Streptomyces sp. NPDC008001 TaxID=3364804 RepID=UPI0036ECC2D4